MSENVNGKSKMMENNLVNIILVSTSFFILFWAFGTASYFVAPALNLMGLNNYGYYSLCVIYAMFALSNIFSPSLVSQLGFPLSFFLSALTYSLYLSSLIHPTKWFIMLSSAALGMGAAVIWTALSTYIIKNSREGKFQRNNTLFYGIFCSNTMFGGLFLSIFFIFFQDYEHWTLQLLFGIFFAVSVFGCLSFTITFTRKIHVYNSSFGDSQEHEPTRSEKLPSPLQSLKNFFLLFKSRIMMSLVPYLIFSGVSLTFQSSVFSAAVVQTRTISSSKSFIGICGLVQGAGGVSTSLLQMAFHSKLTRVGPKPVAMVTVVIECLLAYLVYCIFPDTSPLYPTDLSLPYYLKNVDLRYLVGLIAFTLGLMDSLTFSVIMMVINSSFRESCNSAVGFFKSFQSIATSVAFLYSAHLTIKWHVGILVSMVCVGAVVLFSIPEQTDIDKPANIVSGNASPQADLT